MFDISIVDDLFYNFFSLFSLSWPITDVKFMLCILFVETDRICGHYFLRVKEKEVTINLVAFVSSFVDTFGSMDFSQIFIR